MPLPKKAAPKERKLDEIRGEEAVFDDIPDVKLPEPMTGLAETIIDKMSGTFDPAEFRDRYEDAVVALIQAKQSGEPLKTAQQRRQTDRCAAPEH